MGLVPSPDISTFWKKDVYIHVTNIPDPEKEAEWTDAEEYQLHVGDTFFVNDYVAILDGLSRADDLPGVDMSKVEGAAKAHVRILGRDRQYDAKPVYVIQGRTPGTIPAEVPDLGLRLGFVKIDVATNTMTLAVATMQKDWVIVNALEKPLINLLWIGTILMGVGMGMATYRRVLERA
jgi:cytochrome c-type biogenesis protein CcmF